MIKKPLGAFFDIEDVKRFEQLKTRLNIKSNTELIIKLVKKAMQEVEKDGVL